MILEAPEAIVDDFVRKGEKREVGTVRVKEEVFQEYDSKVDEVSYDSCTVTCL